MHRPHRRATLGNELLAAARRAERVPFELPADLGALFREVGAHEGRSTPPVFASNGSGTFSRWGWIPSITPDGKAANS